MRFPRTNLSNAAEGVSKGEGEDAMAAAEHDEGAAKRRAYLERKLLESREARRRAEIARAEEAKAQAALAASVTPAVDAVVTAPPASVTQPSASADAAESQVWQSAFSLAPNVRFTRTPESQIRRQAPEDAPIAAAPTSSATGPSATDLSAHGPQRPTWRSRRHPLSPDRRRPCSRPNRRHRRHSPPRKCRQCRRRYRVRGCRSGSPSD